MDPFVKTKFECVPTFTGVDVFRVRTCFDGDNIERDVSGIQMGGNNIYNPARLTISTNR